MVLLVLSGCGKEKPTPYNVTLDVWGVFDDSDTLTKLFSEYKKLNPYVRDIRYRKLAPETYREDLINAMAAGTGPDIFMMRNTWQEAFGDKLVPAPTSLISEKRFRDSFLDVVVHDFLSKDGKILATPLSVDTLALYYNKDLFNAAGIAKPPETWEDLLGLVRKLTEIDQYGNIKRSAIALGTGDNINRSSDLLLALMLQLGADPADRTMSSSAAEKALEFYQQFAKVSSPFYTWSPREHYSIDAFYEGTLGMLVNYAYQYDTLRQKNAKLNFAVAPLPQFAGTQPVNFANYWGWAVAKNKTYVAESGVSNNPMSPDAYQTARVHEAWQLIHYLAFPHEGNVLTLYNALSQTSKSVTLTFDPTKQYLDQTKKPAARRDLVEGEKEDARLAPFAIGGLIAKSWNLGPNTEAAEVLIVGAINAINRGERTISGALSVLSARLKQFQ